mmetsp:Transcript_4136/g.18744  ORF Transcript_4136/g.18744 Transcript_4136/m.18744 type:complete len:209 (-) Transcript_4136:224-850(-)
MVPGLSAAAPAGGAGGGPEGPAASARSSAEASASPASAAAAEDIPASSSSVASIPSGSGGAGCSPYAAPVASTASNRPSASGSPHGATPRSTSGESMSVTTAGSESSHPDFSPSSSSTAPSTAASQVRVTPWTAPPAHTNTRSRHAGSHVTDTNGASSFCSADTDVFGRLSVDSPLASSTRSMARSGWMLASSSSVASGVRVTTGPPS